MEGHSPLHKVLETYDHYIWKELHRSDAEYGEVKIWIICSVDSILLVLLFLCIQVYVNALGLLLRIDVRGQKSCIEERTMILADIFEDEVSVICLKMKTISLIKCFQVVTWCKYGSVPPLKFCT